MYFLTPGEAHDTDLLRIIQVKTEESVEQLATAGADPVNAVHEVRKNIKRIRAALRLARFGLGPAAFERENYAFRDLGRKLASARDAAVLRETLHRILIAAEYPEDEIAEIEREIFAGDSAPASVLDPDLAGELIDSFLAVGERVAKTDLATGEYHFIYHGMADTAARARRAFKKAFTPPETMEKFHEWRKQVKYLWHQFEFLSGSGGPAAEVLTEDLEHLAGQLGLAHDAANLYEWLIRKRTASPALDVDGLARRVRRIRLDHEGAARPHGLALFTQKPKALLRWYPQED